METSSLPLALASIARAPIGSTFVVYILLPRSPRAIRLRERPERILLSTSDPLTALRTRAAYGVENGAHIRVLFPPGKSLRPVHAPTTDLH